jgi:hypothetical protein
MSRPAARKRIPVFKYRRTSECIFPHVFAGCGGAQIALTESELQSKARKDEHAV